ncbi:hypothetical protein IPZ68_36995 [Streptomyces arenae]|nr:hypothetical protein [Streptomyces arenae]
MDDPRPTVEDPQPQEPPGPAAAGAGPDVSGQAGVIGIGLAAVLAAAFTQGSWQWFAPYIGVTPLAVVLAFYRLPPSRCSSGGRGCSRGRTPVPRAPRWARTRAPGPRRSRRTRPRATVSR